jgi:hypothetical protein
MYIHSWQDKILHFNSWERFGQIAFGHLDFDIEAWHQSNEWDQMLLRRRRQGLFTLMSRNPIYCYNLLLYVHNIE